MYREQALDSYYMVKDAGKASWYDIKGRYKEEHAKALKQKPPTKDDLGFYFGSFHHRRPSAESSKARVYADLNKTARYDAYYNYLMVKEGKLGMAPQWLSTGLNTVKTQAKNLTTQGVNAARTAGAGLKTEAKMLAGVTKSSPLTGANYLAHQAVAGGGGYAGLRGLSRLADVFV